MISNFPEIRQNSQISGGNIGKIWFIFCFIVGEFHAVRTVVVNIRLAGTKIRLRTKGEYRSSTFNELINERKDERNEAKGLIIMIIIL